MLRLFIFLLLNCLLISKAGAVDLYGGIRENFLTPYAYPFGGQESLRVKRDAFAFGYDGLSLQLRLSLENAQSSTVSLSSLRPSTDKLELFISHIRLSNKKVMLKPIFIANNSIGTPQAFTQVDPTDLNIFLFSYQQSLNVYLNSVGRTPVDELVLGYGMSHLMASAQLAPRWKAIFEQLRTKLGSKTMLSIEINTPEQWTLLKGFYQKIPS